MLGAAQALSGCSVAGLDCCPPKPAALGVTLPGGSSSRVAVVASEFASHKGMSPLHEMHAESANAIDVLGGSKHARPVA